MFTFIDLFAGIGGIRLGLESAGGQCVFSSEWDKWAQQTYAANFGDLPAGDITEIDPQAIPPHDLLAGGFPCQPFSNAGLKRGFDDARGTLFFDVARITEHHRPKVLLLENVKGFARHDKGNTLRVVTEILADLGYSLTWKILNAKDFGLPQNRERIYMVAIRDDLEGVFEKFSFPTPPSSPTKLADVLEKMSVDAKYTISDRLWEGHQRRKREHRLRGNGFGYSLFNADSTYTSTISARYYKDGSEILVSQAGKNPRKITPREAARLQGFPDAYQIVVGDSQAYKQFGNSVAVPVVSAIASKIAEAIGT